MNGMLTSGGYSWTVITVGQRNDYMMALEAASKEQTIKPLAKFVANILINGNGKLSITAKLFFVPFLCHC